jgi:hypothetical protein
MQQALDIFESYCEIWRLQVNVAKTKVMIFRKRKTAQNPKGVGMIRVDFGPISETVYIDIILSTIIER